MAMELKIRSSPQGRDTQKFVQTIELVRKIAAKNRTREVEASVVPPDNAIRIINEKFFDEKKLGIHPDSYEDVFIY